jgi:hypothetical protein
MVNKVLMIDSAVKEKLEQCIAIFPAIGMDCISAFTGITCNVLQPWTILERLLGSDPHNVMLGAGNNLYQAIYAVSFKSEKDMALIASSNFDELIDAWGEFANNYFGMLMDKTEFTDSFGYLAQSIPQYSRGNVFCSKAFACCGTLVTPDKLEINMGFAIRRILL